MTDQALQVVEYAGFKGIRNTASPFQLPVGALVKAQNVLTDKDGRILTRPGYQKLIEGANISSSYTTLDHQTMFLVDSGTLFVFNGSTVQPLVSGLTDEPIYWCEESGERVFMSGGGTALSIDTRFKVDIIPTLGEPIGGIAFHEARLVMAVLRDGYTQLIMALPYDVTQLDEAESSYSIPDTVVGLQSINGYLIIAGTAALWMLSPDSTLIRLTDYGCVPGKPITIGSDKNAYIWTTRGLCRAPEFGNITLNLSSVPPGSGAAVNTFDYQGSRYAVVMSDGEGVSYNAVFEI